MTQPPSLFNLPSDFEKRKRQPFLFENYYRNYMQWFQEGIVIDFKEDIPELTSPDRLALAWHTHGNMLLDALYLRYTAGESINDLPVMLDEIIQCYEEGGKHVRLQYADPTYPAFDLAYLDDYVRYVGLLSLAILLHREDLIPRLHGLIVGSEYDQDDALVEELLSRYLPGRPYLDTFYHDEPYEPLLDATAGDTAEERLADLKTYLKKWYGGMKGTGWYNAHKGMTDEGMGGYFGYWAWEAGAIAYLHGINDTTIDSMYYPKDLVAYARAGGPPPADLSAAEPVLRLRCEAGQPCPRSGYWTSPACKGGGRQFQQGEVMPVIEGNAWGATIWYWEETGQ
ncbi:hypothetical protein HNQ59_001927 [Chitinivorax tropicus]|uniref:PoNi C-terminal domain-containing protein n=1 Tax=Chitinivorax tropicus TaxID=714531 RepID=A0A840MQ96_9PROT|nr:PoNe immunity protein domain-containing protein [Chitinivorax tropicus]MBB5018636.1 hypothetical protein [Chitinivorax tropicus]